jgi:hypothetical protein
MLNLVWKDLRAAALYYCAIVPVLAFASLTGLRSGDAFFWWNVVSAAVLVATPMALDWSEGADRFVHSLPVSREDVVRARYAHAALIAAASFAASLGEAALVTWALSGSGVAWPPWIRTETALAFLLAASGVIALFLPCVFRFGFGAGPGVFAAIVIAGGFAIVPIGRAVGAIGPEKFDLRGVQGIPGGPAARIVVQAVAASGQAGAAAAVVGGAAALLWASMRLSVRFHQSREF